MFFQKHSYPTHSANRPITLQQLSQNQYTFQTQQAKNMLLSCYWQIFQKTSLTLVVFWSVQPVSSDQFAHSCDIIPVTSAHEIVSWTSCHLTCLCNIKQPVCSMTGQYKLWLKACTHTLQRWLQGALKYSQMDPPRSCFSRIVVGIVPAHIPCSDCNLPEYYADLHRIHNISLIPLSSLIVCGAYMRPGGAAESKKNQTRAKSQNLRPNPSSQEARQRPPCPPE